MPAIEMNENERGFATLHREEVVRRVVRRVASVLELNELSPARQPFALGMLDASKEMERRIVEVCRFFLTL